MTTDEWDDLIKLRGQFAQRGQQIEELHTQVTELTATIARKDEEMERLRNKVRDLAKELTEQQDETRELQINLATVRTDFDGVWFWQGDGENHLESLVCPVVMSADKLRELLDAQTKGGGT